ncbi:centromere protein I [Rhinoderma darwinii]|uniref:centromere protein I n=1 Tax=Rhinoderma darwinii TaxID=43563 RepID=UPI003F67A6FA
MASVKKSRIETPKLKQRESLTSHERLPQMMKKALDYFKQINSKVPLKGNTILVQHLTNIESIGLKHGFPADGVDILLRLTLSGNLVENVNIRILKCLIPATELHQDCIIAAVSLFCTGRSTSSTRILFIRWLISVFDLISCKDVLSLLYNFFFGFILDDKLCPILCHLLYLLTRKEHVKPYRVRNLLELQSRKGLQPHILGLLSIYKVFCPELVSLTLPSRIKMYFKDSNLLFTSELKSITRNNSGDPGRDYRLCRGENKKPPSRSVKRKWNSNPYIPVSSSTVWDREVNSFASGTTTYPMEKVQTFQQLLENILKLELPAQMGCVIQSPLLLNFVNCIGEDDSLLRLNYWLSFTLHEECAWYSGQKHNKQDAEAFLNTVVHAQDYLQEGLSGSEEFLRKCLPHWNGNYCTQILQFISWIPLFSFADIQGLLFETLIQLFVSSSLSFKIDVLKTLKKLLQNWLVKHSVFPDHGSADKNDTMSGLMTSVDDMIQFTGRLCTLGIQMHNSPLLLHIILDFYTLVSDVYVRFYLPLIVLPPPAVFYAALLCTDSVNLNQLCYIMCRYRENLLTAKRNEQLKTSQVLNISTQTFQLYNQYLTTMVGCLWTSQAFSHDNHPQGIKMDPELLEKAGVPTYKTTFNIVFHPALLSFAATFQKDRLSEDQMFELHLLKGRYWDSYIEFLCSAEMTDLKHFIDRSVNRVGTKKKEKHELRS